MADELSQSGFDDTIEKLQKELLASSKETREEMHEVSDQHLVVMTRTLDRMQKGIVEGITGASERLQQISNIQEKQTVVEEEDNKKNLWLLTNLNTAMKGLVTLTLGKELSETERRREEDRTTKALLGVLGDIRGGLGRIKDGIVETLKLAANPVGLLGAILGISIGAVTGIASQLEKVLKLGTLLRKAFSPLLRLFGPKGPFAVQMAMFLKDVVRRIMSPFKVIGRLFKALPAAGKIGKFVSKFMVLGKVLGKLFFWVDIGIGVVKGFMGFFDELKKGGDLIDAFMRGIGDFLDWITFGLIDADMLKKIIGEPLREFIEGIKELFTEGFSLETLRKIFEPLGRLVTALPTIVLKAVGKLTAWIAEKLGFEGFADKLRDFLADFTIFDFVKDLVEGVANWFAGLIAKLGELVAGAGDLVASIGKALIDTFWSLVTALQDFIVSQLEKMKLGFLVPKELREQVEERKKVKELQKELGGVSEEAARDELQRYEKEIKSAEELAQQRKAWEDVVVIAEKEGNAKKLQFAKEKIAEIDKEKMALAEASEKRREQLKEGEPATPAEAIPKLQFGGIVSGPMLAQIGEVPEAVIPLDRLNELISGTAVTTAAQLGEQMDGVAAMRDAAAAGPGLNVTSINSPNVSPSAPPTPIIAPVAMRNNENTLRRLMSKEFRGAQP